jgi:serine/threonine protein kinase
MVASADVERRTRIQQFCSDEILTAHIEHIFDFQDATVLGTGTIGEVVRAKDKKTQQHLALKIVSMGRLRELGLPASKLHREVAVLSELIHPNIIRLVDVLQGYNKLSTFSTCVTGKPPYFCIVTEAIEDAQPLSEVIRHGGSLPSLAWTIVPQLVDALAFIHSKGIIHRDVWSENVLLDRTRSYAVLVDFGTAEYACTEALGHFLNVPYMSPQAAAGEWQNPADDAWCFGILVTELVTGAFVTERMGGSDRPFCDELECLATAINETFAIAEAFGSMASTLLQRDVSARHTMQDVQQYLEKCLGPRPDLISVCVGDDEGLEVTGSSPTACMDSSTLAPSRIGLCYSEVNGSKTPVQEAGGATISEVKERLLRLHDDLAEIKVLFSGCSSEEAEAIIQRFSKGDEELFNEQGQLDGSSLECSPTLVV